MLGCIYHAIALDLFGGSAQLKSEDRLHHLFFEVLCGSHFGNKIQIQILEKYE